MSNIGGIHDLADQLPINREFGQFLVVSRSQVPREFGVNLAYIEIKVAFQPTQLSSFADLATKLLVETKKGSLIEDEEKNGNTFIQFSVQHNSMVT